MIKHFLNLEWKQFFRSPTWQKSIALKILMGFFALYFIVAFLFMGAVIYYGIKKRTSRFRPLFSRYRIFILLDTWRFNDAFFPSEIANNDGKTIINLAN